jgi:hypothetical protein
MSSQQSNPATLREALSELRCVADDLYMNLKAAAQFNPEGFNTPALEQVFQRFKMAAAKSVEIETALAASGTEAAPIPEEQVRAAITAMLAEGKIHMTSDRWLEVPAQAAAIPEGETKLTRLLDRLDELIAEHDQPQIPSNIRDWLEIEIAAMLRQSASPEGEGREQRNWKGVRWADSVRASTLAEEIALHFAHDCNDSMCGEDADANNCEVAWIEDKLTDFLNVQAALRQSAAPSGGAALVSKLRNLPVHKIGASNSSWDDVEPTEYVRMSDLNALLAQESQSGAVTEPR